MQKILTAIVTLWVLTAAVADDASADAQNLKKSTDAVEKAAVTAPADKASEPSPSPSVPAKPSPKHAMKVALGTALYFDINLSKNRTMSCATCHDPATAFVDQRNQVADNMASLGDDGQSIGDRNAPTAAYAMFFPVFQKNTGSRKDKSAFLGGQFLDGREPDLAGQAGGPPLNPIEMGMPDKASVVARIRENPAYVGQFQAIYGDDVFQNVDKAYASMADAIGEFEKGEELFAPFDSKYDRFLRGEYELTVLEDLGRSLFFSNANVSCSTCHKLQREDHPREVFSNFEYHNIGVPTNVALRKLNGVTATDFGLWHNPKAQFPESKGKFKVPTLRNVAVTGPYMHNGVFKDLRTVVLFYDKYNNPERKLNPETGKPWGEPEVPDNLALDDLKAQAMTDRKIDAMVAFLKTLTDKRYEPMLEQAEKAEKSKQH